MAISPMLTAKDGAEERLQAHEKDQKDCMLTFSFSDNLSEWHQCDFDPRQHFSVWGRETTGLRTVFLKED